MLEPLDRRSIWLALGLFGAIALLIGADLLEDASHGVGASHVAVEGTAVLLALIGVGGFGRRALAIARDKRRLEREAGALTEELAKKSAEAERWRSEARQLVEGLASAIDRQFEQWELSPAERQVGLLLLKGLSHQEIADLRGVSERTVRQQARGLYKKSGLGGRADLSAFFLEDLLVISPAQAAEGGSQSKN